MTFPVPGLRGWCCGASVKSRVQIPSTCGVATHPATAVLWEMAAKGSLELAGYQASFGSAGNPISKERSGK